MNHLMNQLNLLVPLLLVILTMGKQSKRAKSKNKTQVVYSGSSQCVWSNGFTVENLHGKRIKAGMEIAGIERVDIQICDAYAKTYIKNKPCMWIIQNGIDATTIDDQDESLLHLRQARDHGSIVEDKSHVHSWNKMMHASETNIPLK